MTTTPIVGWKRMYPGGDTAAEVFTKLVGGPTAASTVHNALSVAARVFDDDSDEFRAIATAIACDGEQVPMMTLRGAEALALQFERQAEDTRRLLALLRGADETEEL